MRVMQTIRENGFAAPAPGPLALRAAARAGWRVARPGVGDAVDEHALVGRPTLSVGTIQGGVSVNTVPDLCTIEIDRRLLPDEDPIPVLQGKVVGGLQGARRVPDREVDVLRVHVPVD